MPTEKPPMFTRELGAAGETRYVIGRELVVGNRQDVRDSVLRDLAAGDRAFVFDFAQCVYLDGSGLGLLVTISKRIREAGGRIVLEHLNEDLRLLLAITKIDT